MPQGVQKERMQAADMFVLNLDGSILQPPAQGPVPGKPSKLSECAPLFMAAYELRGAGAVLHSHALEAMMVTLLDERASEFRCTRLEMIKGIAGHGYHDMLVVPIIENTAREAELTEALRGAIVAYPKTCAVLVRRHGVYVWGDSWVQAKTHAECYHYLFQAAVDMRRLGMAPPAPAEPGRGMPACVVLDVEGTTTPISFVETILFPYARENAPDFVRRHLRAGASGATVAALAERVVAAAELKRRSREGAIKRPLPAAGGEDEAVAALKQAVLELMDDGVKEPALKELQGLVWEEGYRSGRIVGAIFDDVALAMRAWVAGGAKIYIYSSGSRLAQRLLFGHSEASPSDLRPLLCGFFDTSSGHKTEPGSYANIADSLGVSDPASVLFYTDAPAEAAAALQAGWRAALVVRPGNKPLPAQLPSGAVVVHGLLQPLPEA